MYSDKPLFKPKTQTRAIFTTGNTHWRDAKELRQFINPNWAHVQNFLKSVREYEEPVN